MSCDVISCSRSADYTQTYVIAMDLTGYLPEFSVSDSAGGSNRLALTSTATPNGSLILLSSADDEQSIVSLLIKTSDIIALPAGNPWVGVSQFRLVAPTGVRTRIEETTFEVEGAI